MSSSKRYSQQVRKLSRISLFITGVLVASLLAGCDGGLFGTGTGEDADIVSPAANSNSESDAAPGMSAPEPEATPNPDTPSESPSAPADTAESDAQPISIDFSNTTPSGIEGSSAALPSLKLINLTEFNVTVATVENEIANQSVSVLPQRTSDLLGVNTGETTVSLRREDNDFLLASISPLNAVADSVTTLVLEELTENSQQEGELVTSLLVLDTQAVVSASGMAEVRIVSTDIANESSSSRSFTLTPTGDNSNGAELVLIPANADNPAVGVYSLANAGSYVLNSNDGSISSQPITLSADTVYTIIITRNLEIPVYLEVDSLSSE